MTQTSASITSEDKSFRSEKTKVRARYACTFVCFMAGLVTVREENTLVSNHILVVSGKKGG